jgi:hypothetical protein
MLKDEARHVVAEEAGDFVAMLAVAVEYREQNAVRGLRAAWGQGLGGRGAGRRGVEAAWRGAEALSWRTVAWQRTACSCMTMASWLGLPGSCSFTPCSQTPA